MFNTIKLIGKSGCHIFRQLLVMKIHFIFQAQSYLEPRENDYDYPEFIPSQKTDASAGSSPTSGFSHFYSIASTSNISDFYETGFNDNQLNNFNGEIGASKMYCEPSYESDNYDVCHSNHAAAVKQSCPSDGYFTDALALSITEVPNYLELSKAEADSNTGTGSQKPHDTHAQKSSVENKRLSNRFFPGFFVSEKNYPNAARAPSQRISQWLSSAACGVKKFGGFINFTRGPSFNSDS